MALAPGTRLGPYEISALIGAGGMGEVYKARDSRLDRTVAIKVLPTDLAANPERRQRFEREARAISSLTHPHICTLHDVGEQDQTPFLVMEFLDGESLADRLAKGRLALPQALQVATEIADALAAAHKLGVVHRDLKPGNVMLTKTGVKLLDFGLAKWRGHGEQPAVTSAVSMVTRTAPLTTQGTIVGTLQYMAPEQIEGREADARTDLFAFGAIVYEMVSGRRPFDGATTASLMAAILEREPAPLALSEVLTPPSLDRLVRKCLAKLPDDRWDSAHDVADELRWIAQTLGETAATVKGQATRQRLVPRVLVPAVLVMAAVGGGVAWMLPRPANQAARPIERFEIGVTPAHELLNRLLVTSSPPTRGGTRTAFAWSPRGLVFVGNTGGLSRLYVRDLASPQARPLVGTEGAEMPVLSPDARFVVFYAFDETSEASIKRIALDGGAAEMILETGEFPPFGMAVSAAGTVAFARQDGAIWQARVGAKPVQVAAPQQGETRYVLPRWLVDDQVLLYTARESTFAWGGERVVAHVLSTRERKVLLRDAADARYVATGHLVFMRRGTLMAVSFDRVALEVTGDPVPVRQGVAQAVVGSEFDLTGAGQFDISGDGHLAYIPSLPVGWPDADVVTVDRQGHVRSVPVRTRSWGGSLHVASDGRMLALTDIGNGLVWTGDLERRSLLNLTDDGEAFSPRWTPDGRRIAFRWVRQGKVQLAWRTADLSGKPDVLVERDLTPSSWSPDGRHLAVDFKSPTRKQASLSQIAVVTLGEGEPRVTPIGDIGGINEAAPAFSPDGKWLAYQSSVERGGRFEIFVRSYPDLGSPLRVSDEGGENPVWNPRGGELFYAESPGSSQRIMSVRFDERGPGTPRPLFRTEPGLSFGCRTDPPVPCYAVSPDGDRFYALRTKPTPPPAPVTHVNVVLNWIEELKANVRPARGR